MKLSYGALQGAALTTALCVSFAQMEHISPPEFRGLQPGTEGHSAPLKQPQRASVEENPQLDVLESALEQTQRASVEQEPQIEAPEAAIPAPAKMTKNEVMTLVGLFARAHGVPAGFAKAVVHVESSYNPHATGSVGEIGLMQIKYDTARMIGFAGTREQLYEPATNLTWGMKYLAGAWKLGGKSPCGAVIRYQGGHGRTTHTSVSKRYCAKVQKFMAAN